MLSAELRPPEEIPTITEGQYYYESVRIQQEDLALRRKGALWERIATIATGGLSTVALIAAVSAWFKQGRITPVK